MIFTDVAAVTGRAHRADRAAFYGLTIFSTILQAVATIGLVPVLSALFGDEPSEAWPWVAMMTAALVVGWATDMAATRAGVRVGFGVVDAAEQAGVRAIRTLDTADLHGERASMLRELVAKSGPDAVSAIVLLFSPLIRAALMVPFLSIGLLLVSWPLGLVGLVAGAALFGAFFLSRRAVAKAEDGFAAAGRELDDRMLEFAWAQPTLRAAGVGPRLVDDVISRSRSRGFRLLAWQIPGDVLFSMVGQVVLIALGVTAGALYLSADLSGPTAAALIVVGLRMVETTGSLSLLATPYAGIRRTLADLRELVELEDDVPASTEVAHDPADVVLEAVDYSYPDGTRALDGVDLTIGRGEITVIVGHSGSGKSTLLDIVAGLREPSGGQVCVGGSTTDAGARLAGSAVVFQTTLLRPGTVRENVVTGDAADLREIADLAQLDSVLAVLPDGWESKIGEGGNALSGGERQRVGLARALAKPAPVLLVDEATSSLDVVTERAVVESLQRIRGTRTIVVVTHRPALVAIADSVVVLDEGRVAESGPVDELLVNGGVFADLWQRWRASEGWQV
ncbi:MAG: ABC transporter ATP-binding protein/permease [Gordonia sp. (in: high G+C Gram-positive bacteria)]|jgi:ATP-binding cassette subfamily B protein IrtB|nr:ABC transporter ATP-binding protein/permease [Gordonia sp. (in: high G+C Gram-positive bacteria)]